ncbi:MAG: hypothetical protein IPM50_13675 [Acidobacteriota bacterium]|nr:MAG: hypothetical protein IPM50_13675 [Acidobacteriota bacterium]
MKFDRKQAKALTSEKELELYDDARAPRLTKHSVADLKRLVKRSRTLRDKLRDVKKSQVRGAQKKTKARGLAAPDRSREKAEMFAEVHDIFVARLEALEKRVAKEKEREASKKLLASAAKSKAPKAAAKPARSAKATTASKAAKNPAVDTVQKPQTAARTRSTKAKVEQTRIARSGITQKRSHLASTNKRNQARRDSK